MHYWVERRFKIDDAVGAVAVHGYAGFLGVVAAGFLLWGYPSSPDALLGHTEAFARVTPWGQLAGAVIMFFVLGFIPGYVLSWILKQVGSFASRARWNSPASTITLHADRRSATTTSCAPRSRAEARLDTARSRRLGLAATRAGGMSGRGEIAMTNSNFTDWNGNIFDIGPIYPFVGWEVLMVIVLVVFWIGWHFIQIRMENDADAPPPRTSARRQPRQGARGRAHAGADVGKHMIVRARRSRAGRAPGPPCRIRVAARGRGVDGHG